MPCATIHLLIADGLLRDWSARPESAPIDPGRPDERAAFLHGSLAPDMGFIPGVDRFVSDLAHYVQPVDLTLALLDGAGDRVDRAFAWGWAAHVVGDIDVHPIVGREVGSRLYGDRERRVDAEEDCATHVAVEVGLDIAVLHGRPEVSKPPRNLHFDRNRIEHLIGALHSTYEVRWGPDELLRSHRRAVALTRRWPWALGHLGACLPGGPGSRKGPGSAIVSTLVSTARRFTGDRSAVRGFLSPQAPSDWMLREVRRAVEAVPGRFREIVEDPAKALPDRNLETGGPAGAGFGHPAADQTVRKLQSVRARRSAIG